ncbi:Guanine nucleotide exchange factor, Ric8 [Kalmanozyma brasiliensis GHG001]|uniref:Synembryn-A n=1 Tax=Kalmanozyma brasiliensis (strain GHG001) TaxID=1365824 RepID=V5E912_KALBG|nr:Guanine nucleotide exchange factor, Ric8 [Kalmanozyma brasiliensis GHG001]EST06836.1 Guanine nucleotide exchange factor, Ric8 [Kalmanozyma brasiliensis GHG001]
MSDTIREYLSLPSSTRVDSPTQAHQWLDTLLAGGLPVLGSVSDSIRTKLATAVLTDIGAASGTREGDLLLNARSNVKWNSAIRLSALKLLKELSRLPGGSTPMAKPESLRILLQQIDFPRQRVRRSPPTSVKRHKHRISTASSSSTTSSFSASSAAHTFSSIAKSLRRAVSRRGSHRSERRGSKDKDMPSSDSSSEEYGAAADPDWPITDMALRCLNNALFLNEDARLPFSSDEIGGGHAAVALLSQPQDTPADILFLGARLLFFSTLFESPFNKTAVTTLDVVRIEAACVDALVQATLGKAANKNAASCVLIASGSAAQFSTALSDLLKAHFNICLYYPRIVNAEAKEGGSTQAAASAEPAGADQAISGEGFDAKLLDMLSPLVSVITALPLSSPVPLTPPATHAIAALLNYPAAEVKKEILADRATGSSTFPTLTAPISPSSTPALQSAPLYLSRLITFVDLMLARYFSAPLPVSDGRRVPEDVDARSIKQKATANAIELEDTLEPLLLLLRKTAAEDDDLRSILRTILLPNDLDRSLALDRRLDVLGRLIRLMSSVTLPRTARASGELLLALCNGEAKQMTDTIGYGPCAGFLMNTGLASALPTGSAAQANGNGRAVDPITGEYEPTDTERAMDEMSRMTEEEKEAEAERLFVLFDRMNRTGVIQARHPMEAAHDSGRFEEISAKAEAEERERQEREDEETEREVERDMAAHRRRKEEARKLATPDTA